MSFDEMMKNLKKEYVRDLPGKIASLRQFCDASNLTQLREEFHKLKGTGKTYGIPEVSELCATLEQICLQQSIHAITDSQAALEILASIHQARSEDKAFAVAQDPRFIEIQKHLAS